MPSAYYTNMPEYNDNYKIITNIYNYYSDGIMFWKFGKKYFWGQQCHTNIVYAEIPFYLYYILWIYHKLNKFKRPTF